MSMRSLLLATCLVGSAVLAETFELNLEPGWNLVSIPIVPDEPAVSVVFGGGEPISAWGWNGRSWVAAQRVEAGLGYFVHVAGGGRDGGQPIDIAVSGQPPENLRIPLHAGWNVVGTVGASPWPAVELPFHASTAAHVAVLNVAERFRSPGLSIKRWDEASGTFGEFAVPPDDQRVVVFIHGWQTFHGITKGQVGDSRGLYPEIETWEALATYATGHPADYASRFEFYTIRYDSDKSIYDNAVDVHALLAASFPARRIVVVAHSMGALISHAMSRGYHPDGRSYAPWSGGIDRLVTLDTPFHGSPMVQMLHQGTSAAGSLAGIKGWAVVQGAYAFLCLTTPGTIDLAWDQFDNHALITRGNPNLAALNAEPHTPASLPAYHTFGAGLFPARRDAFAVSGDAINSLLGYDNDGIVPVVSSHLRTFAAATYGVRTTEVPLGDDPRYDHTEIWAGKIVPPATVDTAHYDRILAQLPPLAAGAAGDYLVIDVSAGPAASSYPVSYLTAVPAGGWPDEYKTTKIVLRRIPAGTFIMGSPEDELGRRTDGREDQRSVTLTRDFYIGVFQVTQKQWERVMDTWPSYFNNATYRDSRPVELVSWNDIRGGTWPGSPAGSGQPVAGTFVQKLRDRTGLPLDLPTEAQWEYAARAGTTKALNAPWDDGGRNLTGTSSCPNMAAVGRYWYNGGSGYSSGGTTAVGSAKVGSYPPNAWGLYDMHGNVWEWCLDWYTASPAGGADPLGPGSGADRAGRGALRRAFVWRWRHEGHGCPFPKFRNPYLTENLAVP